MSASPHLPAVLGLEPWGLTELWGSKILSSTTQAYGDGCSGGKEPLSSLGLHLIHVWGLPCRFPRARKAPVGAPVFGQHPEEAPRSWLTLPECVCGALSIGPRRPSGCAPAAAFIF